MKVFTTPTTVAGTATSAVAVAFPVVAGTTGTVGTAVGTSPVVVVGAGAGKFSLYDESQM